MAIVRTVLGDITPDQAGTTLTHEHIRYAYPGCELDHRCVWDFDFVAQDVGKQFKEMREGCGIATVVELTPPEIGRHPELFAQIARNSGMHIVATTGFFPESNAMGIPFHWRRQRKEDVINMLIRDLTEGMVYDGRKTPYRAGILKAATGSLTAKTRTPVNEKGRRIGQVETHVISAIAAAQREVGCAINTHTQPLDYEVCNPGIELLDELEEGGADPTKVIIGHAFVHPNIDQLKAICERGAGVQVDHIGIPWQNDSRAQLDELIAVAMCQLADLGHLDKIVVSYDKFFSHARGPVTEHEPEQLNELVPNDYIMTEFAPRLERKGFGARELHQVMVENPKRLLAF